MSSIFTKNTGLDINFTRMDLFYWTHSEIYRTFQLNPLIYSRKSYFIKPGSSSANLRIAFPRWEMAPFSAGDNSAMARFNSGTKKIGS